MAKQMPRKRPDQLNKKQLSRSRREKQQLRWVWISVGALAAIVIALVAVGLISQNTRTMAVVNGEPIKVSDYQKRVRYYYYSLGPDVFEGSEQDQPNQVYQLVADQLVEEALIWQEAKKRDVTATDQEIQIEMEETWFQHYRDPPAPPPTPTTDPEATATPEGTPPDPTATPDTQETYDTNYQLFVDNVLKPARLNESYLRQLVEVSVLRQKLEQTVEITAPTEEDQILFRYAGAADADDAMATIASFQAGVREEAHARHILVETREEAETILKQLGEGGDFAAIAAELSTDTSNKDDGGDLGWFARGRMVEAFDQVAFESPIGLHPEPVETEFGFHVIDVLGREMRLIDLDSEMFEVGWYGKAQMSQQFGALFAEMLFGAEIGLLPDPVPTSFGVAIVETLAREVRTLDAAEQESRRQEGFQTWLDEIRKEGDIVDQWEPSMIPTRI